MANKTLGKRSTAEYQAIGKLVEELYLANSRNPRRVLWFGFLRGLAYGIGIFVGGTIVVALVLWFLGLFDEAPIIGPFVQNIVDNLN